MKKLLTISILLAALASCGGNKSSNLIPMAEGGWMADTTKTEDNSHADPALVEERVKAIYEHVAAAYPDLPDLTPSNDSLDLAFCSGHWQSLVALVNEKDAASMGSEHFFDADYWIMGQEWGNISATDVKATVKDNTHAEATLLLHNCGTATKVKLEMVFERGEWLIDNFIDQTRGDDWKKNMIEYIEQKEAAKGKNGDAKDDGIIEYEY